MCGVFGFDKLTERTRAMIPVLAVYMEQRGRASWGVTNGREIVKKASAITDTFELCEWSPSIYHTRAASVGSVCEANAHPFESIVGNRRVIGVHNGHISNHDELDTKYKRKFAVDSMHIFQHIAEGLDVGEIEGWGNVIWSESRTDAPKAPVTVFLSRFNNDALHVVKLDTKEGELVWASTTQALHAAMRFAGVRPKCFYKVEENKKYSIGADGFLHGHGDMKWSKTLRSRATGACGYDIRKAGGKDCAVGGCPRPREAHGLVCQVCLSQLFDSYVESYFPEAAAAGRAGA